MGFQGHRKLVIFSDDSQLLDLAIKLVYIYNVSGLVTFAIRLLKDFFFFFFI